MKDITVTRRDAKLHHARLWLAASETLETVQPKNGGSAQLLLDHLIRFDTKEKLFQMMKVGGERGDEEENREMKWNKM